MTFTFLYIRDRLNAHGLKTIPVSYLATALIVVIIFGTIVEMLQETLKLGRSGEFKDVLYDLTGYIIGLVISVLKHGVRFRKL